MDVCPKCSKGLIQLNMNGLNFQCMLCKYTWVKKNIIKCTCGKNTDLSNGNIRSLRMRKDGKVGWIECESCGKYLNKDEAVTNVSEI